MSSLDPWGTPPLTVLLLVLIMLLTVLSWACCRFEYHTPPWMCGDVCLDLASCWVEVTWPLLGRGISLPVCDTHVHPPTAWVLFPSGMAASSILSEVSEIPQSCPTLCHPMDSSLHQAPPSMGFSRQEYWSGLPFPSPGNLPDPGIEPRSPSL